MFDSATSPSNLVGIGLGLALLLCLVLMRRVNSRPLPPGPWSYPFVGHLFSMPASNSHLAFIKLGNQLKTNLLSLSSLGRTTVVLNSVEDATNLLKNRSGIYSDRYCPPMLADPLLMDSGRVIDFLGYNDRLRKCRRLIHPWLNKKACESFHKSKKQDARLLLQQLMIRDCISSETLYNEIFTALSGTLLRSIYGCSIGGKDDPLLEQAMEFVQNLCEAAIPGNFLVNTFPSLRYIPSWFPGARWKQVAREWREQKNKTLNDFYSKTKEKIALGNHEQSIIASSLSEAKALGLSSEEADDYLSHIGITLYLGGTDTTCNVILVFFIAMIHFPATQQKAQAEIDEVIGDSRLPEMEDMHQLPYTNCLIQEVLRWCPIVPLGVPHAASKDDFYRGFLIPKGATVIGNIWAMSRDKRFYKDPEEFNPDRFSDPLVPPCPAFGFGRRECPVIHFAESSLFSIIASILASFNIKGPENIKSSAPELVSTNDFVFHPKEFEVLMEPRSVKHAHLICSEI